MNSVNDLTVSKLLPSSLKSDVFTIALVNATEKELKQAFREAESLADLSNIDQLPEYLLDYIAYQKHVDFYENTLSIEIKRGLIKRSRFFHQHKGTPAAVEELINMIFGDGKVVEWFEYDGQPFHFKVVTNNRSVTQEKAEEFLRALNSVKRKTAILDKIELSQSDEMNQYFAFVVQSGEKLVLRQVN